jgi:ketosteroid isomerase-like protein
VDAAEVVGKLSRVFASGDWRAMRALYHRDALVLTVTGGPTALTADDVTAELERASKDAVYFVRGSEPTPLDEHAAIVTGRMRWRLPQGGFEEAGHVWLLTVRDGLIYRQGVYDDTATAVDAYRRLGVTLGLSDASSMTA